MAEVISTGGIVCWCGSQRIYTPVPNPHGHAVARYKIRCSNGCDDEPPSMTVRELQLRLDRRTLTLVYSAENACYRASIAHGNGSGWYRGQDSDPECAILKALAKLEAAREDVRSVG